MTEVIMFEVTTDESVALSSRLAKMFAKEGVTLEDAMRACTALAVYACKRRGLPIDVVHRLVDNLDETPLPPDEEEEKPS